MHRRVVRRYCIVAGAGEANPLRSERGHFFERVLRTERFTAARAKVLRPFIAVHAAHLKVTTHAGSTKAAIAFSVVATMTRPSAVGLAPNRYITVRLRSTFQKI